MLIGIDIEAFHRLSLDDQFELELWCINEEIEFKRTWQIVLVDESANELWHCYYLENDERHYYTTAVPSAPSVCSRATASVSWRLNCSSSALVASGRRVMCSNTASERASRMTSSGRTPGAVAVGWSGWVSWSLFTRPYLSVVEVGRSVAVRFQRQLEIGQVFTARSVVSRNGVPSGWPRFAVFIFARFAWDQWTLDGDLLCKVVAHGERKHRTKVRPNLGWMAVLPDDQIPTSMRTVSSTPTASERGAQ